MKRIEIQIAGIGKATAELDNRNPVISEELYGKLPLEAEANLWGEEIYFKVPAEMRDENLSPDAAAGDISYWSPGRAFCIFFGQTQPYSPVNHLGRVTEGLHLFKQVRSKDRIALSRK